MTVLKRRNLILGLALAGTMVLVMWVDGHDPQVEEIKLAQPQRKVARPSATVSVTDVSGTLPPSLQWSMLAGRIATVEQTGSDLLKSHSWYVPPPAKPVGPPPPPPKPVAPAAPYTYLGKMEDTPQGTQVILAGGNKVYTVALGATLDKSWRVDGEDAGSIRLTYLPLGLPQTISKTARPIASKPNETRKTETEGTAS